MNPGRPGGPRLLPCGDAALTVEFGAEISPELNARVVALGDALRGRPGIVALIPTYRSLFIQYDPFEVSFEELSLAVERLPAVGAVAVPPPEPVIELPVCYHPSLAPDLAGVARLRGLTVEEAVAFHAAPVYRVYMLGFTPGFLFLGGLDPRLHTPRLPEPRKRVEPGSVGIAGAQTGAYAIASPGGWRLIGRTPVRLFDPAREPPVVATPGMGVRFVPIGLEEYRRLEGRGG
ncbi:MAG: 5-oxoprolinase subunit PxpB [Deltaproteobacteria bacterium]|nr:5-oxoprolinase subunit PxpB [Deltaproteobacteria bacterium]